MNKVQKETESDETKEESEYEMVTDDEDEQSDSDSDENEALSVRLSQLKQEKENAESMQDKLNLLSSSLDSIRSQPMIIDLTKKRQRNHDLSQQLIGRQMKLRDYRQKYEKMQTDLKNIKM